MRKICYVSGNRADFGLMTQTLRLLHTSPTIDLSICITAMHLSKTYGLTMHEIEAEKFRICGRIVVDVENTTEANMANAIGHEILGFVKVFSQEKPDVILLLGDRGEMLAAAIAALHLNIPIAHIHGGERSGTVDESVRHAVSKLSHYHFVATAQSRERLIKMGECPEHIFVTGSPGLDGLHDQIQFSREALCIEQKFDLHMPIGLMIFHPVVQEISDIHEQIEQTLIAALEKSPLQLVCYTPNSDAGGHKIRDVLAKFTHHPLLRITTNLIRPKYLSWLMATDVMLGNSSSAIIESPSFGLTVINIGTRQNARERSDNVLDVSPVAEKISAAIQQVLQQGKTTYENIYGDGKASTRILSLLQTIPLDKSILFKSNTY
jgi:GDP/UDP-N,N'-diacetylbacillosamine 2-epimerase (hydrolysing)